MPLFTRSWHRNHLMGFTARMIAEWMPGAASVVKVTDTLAIPAAVRPYRPRSL